LKVKKQTKCSSDYAMRRKKKAMREARVKEMSELFQDSCRLISIQGPHEKKAQTVSRIRSELFSSLVFFSSAFSCPDPLALAGCDMAQRACVLAYCLTVFFPCFTYYVTYCFCSIPFCFCSVLIPLSFFRVPMRVFFPGNSGGWISWFNPLSTLMMFDV